MKRLYVPTIVFLFGIVFGGSVSLVVKHSYERRKVLGYRDVAFELMNPNLQYRIDWNDDLDLPSEVNSKETAALYLLMRLSDLDLEEETGANYGLGFFFLSRDKNLALEFLSMHLEDVPFDDDAKKYVSRILEERSGDRESTLTSSTSTPD